MTKRLQFLVLAMMWIPASMVAQVRTSVPVGDAISASIGRGRTLNETTAGKHNLVVMSGRRMKPDCAEGKALIARRDAAHNDQARFDQLNTEYQKIIATDACGFEFYHSENMNLVVNAGLNWLADIMSSTSAPGVNLQCNWFAVTPTAISPGATDVALSGEITNNGFNSTGGAGSGTRAQATYAHSANATTYTLTKTYTATGAQTVAGAAVFTANASTTMCFEDAVTSATLATNDTLQLVWTVTI